MTTAREAADELAAGFLRTADLAERMALVRAAVDGRSADEAISVIASALSVATDQLRAVLEITVPLVGGDIIMAELQKKMQQRAADYLEHQFRSIVASLDGGAS